MAPKLLYYSHVNKDPLLPEIHQDSRGLGPSRALLGVQRIPVLGYLVVELLDRLAALRRLRFHRRRVRVASAERRHGLVQRLHVDYADAERGAA